jgi:hypothetical protein
MDLGWLVRRLTSGRPVVIVSGLPRSGTSMAMRMLAAGGLPAVTDGVRGGDDDNPHGYFEHERVKGLAGAGDRRWLRDCRGRALKVVSPLLKHLPRGLCYQVIFLERDLDEILDSQERMLRNRGVREENVSREALREAFAREVEAARRLLARVPHFRALFLAHADVLAAPPAAAAKINAFLGGGLDEPAMAAAVDRSLRDRPRKR